MKAISKKPICYVCEEERSLPQDEQTKFWIQPKTHQEANRMMKRYGGTYNENAKGFREYDVNKLNNADQEEWLDTVVKIENFKFTDEFYKSYPLIKEKTNKKGYIDVIENNDDLMIEVLRSLMPDTISEIWRASQNASRLRQDEKND